jgi:hypothetical protein
MRSSDHLPVRFPVGSKYVLEGRGPFIRRYIEFPDGRRVQLTKRKAVSCSCKPFEQVSIAPDQTAAEVDAPLLRSRSRAKSTTA